MYLIIFYVSSLKLNNRYSFNDIKLEKPHNQKTEMDLIIFYVRIRKASQPKNDLLERQVVGYIAIKPKLILYCIQLI